MKTLVFDLDGTMYRGTQIIESAHQFLDYCIQNKIPFIFFDKQFYAYTTRKCKTYARYGIYKHRAIHVL